MKKVYEDITVGEMTYMLSEDFKEIATIFDLLGHNVPKDFKPIFSANKIRDYEALCNVANIKLTLTVECDVIKN